MSGSGRPSEPMNATVPVNWASFWNLLSTKITESRSRPRKAAASLVGGKLQEAARHGDILQEMDHLVLIAEVAVRDERGGDAPGRQDNPCQARLIADNEQYAADAFYQDRNDRGNERKREPFRAHERHRAAELGELLEPAQHEDHGKQEPSEESGCIARWRHGVAPFAGWTR